MKYEENVPTGESLGKWREGIINLGHDITLHKYKQVWILCNDCGAEGEVQFHVVAHKCLDCNSYNTKQTIGRRRTASCSSTTVPEIVS